MFKFFQKIRQRLIEGEHPGEAWNEKNTKQVERFKKYLVYAIGEIVLVVIGILIAIQINGCNENRKSKNQEIAILKELSSSIQSNIDIIKQTIQHDSTSLKSIENLFHILENNLPYSDSIPFYFVNAIASFPTSLSYSTMETIRAKGVDIIQSEQIRNQVLNLFDSEYAQIKEIYNTDQQSYNNIEQSYILKNFQIGNKGAIPNNYSYIQDDQEIINILSMRKLYREYSLITKENAIIKSNELINKIQNYLPK